MTKLALHRSIQTLRVACVRALCATDRISALSIDPLRIP